jgi:predicted Rossmann fold flavoprotein
MNKFDVIIIGAGASGLMCAIEAGKRGRSVLVLERSEKAGKKILISGGGKCNFTNMSINQDNYISRNVHFCKSALSRYTQNDFLTLIDKYKIEYQEKTPGQLFCSTRSNEILNMLLAECKENGVKIKYNFTIKKISKENNFVITGNEDYETVSLVIATGGISIPKIGATHFGYDIARQFGLNIVKPEPSLVGLTLCKSDLDILENLSGVSVDAVVSCNGCSFHESILFTHTGLSGPAILQISNYWNKGDEIEIDLLPRTDIISQLNKWKLNNPKAELKNLLGLILPKRLAGQLTAHYIKNKPINQYNEKDFSAINNLLHKWRITPSGTEGFDKAEVTRGGIDTNELSSKTFESKKVKGLYFTGEVIDVTGWLGGYNFQWAWSSGFCAGQFV